MADPTRYFVKGDEYDRTSDVLRAGSGDECPFGHGVIASFDTEEEEALKFIGDETLGHTHPMEFKLYKCTAHLTMSFDGTDRSAWLASDDFKRQLIEHCADAAAEAAEKVEAEYQEQIDSERSAYLFARDE